MDPQFVVVVPGMFPCGNSYTGSIMFGGAGLHLPVVSAVCAPSRQGYP